MVRVILIASAIGTVWVTPGVAQSRSSDPLRPLTSERLQKDLRFTPRQKQRVRELMLQWEGAKALRRRDVAKQLGLRKTQQDAIDKIYESHTRLEFEYYKMRRIDRDKSRKLYSELRESSKTLSARVMEVLTAAQRARFDRMLGKRFDRARMYEPIGRPDV